MVNHRLTKRNQEYQLRVTRKVTLNFLFLLVVTIIAGGCRPKKQELIDSFMDRSKMPLLHTFDASSLISDSGITRYKVISKEWLIFDKSNEPYWYFPQGLYVEKFDSLLQVEGSIRADTAYFFDQRKLWKLIGNVHVMNLNGEQFTTNLLFWDQNLQKIYSDSFITITQPERIIFGYGFESNESMTIYRINKSSGTFLVNEDQQEEQ